MESSINQILLVQVVELKKVELLQWMAYSYFIQYYNGNYI